eukprot:11280905-Alexandrium_andersonii.AAC.1
MPLPLPLVSVACHVRNAHELLTVGLPCSDRPRGAQSFSSGWQRDDLATRPVSPGLLAAWSSTPLRPRGRPGAPSRAAGPRRRWPRPPCCRSC